MEGKNEKVEQEIQEVDVPMVAEAVSKEIPRAPQQPIEAPEQPIESPEQPIEGLEGEQPTETPEESDEEYFEEDDIDEEQIKEGYGDDDWEEGIEGSEAAPLGGLYGLFKDVSRQKDTKRVSNLTKEELGVWNLSLRDCERIALIAETFHHEGVAEFFRKQSRIISDTAMSKGGWFTELFITSKKFASRDTSSSISNLPQFSKKSKWRIFSDKGNQTSQEQMQ